MSSAPTSFAKNIKEAVVVFLDDISFRSHREVSILTQISEISDEQSFVLVVGKKPISLDAVPQGKRYMFVGITKLIYEAGYPFATSLAVADAETAKIVVDDILVCAEDGDAIIMSPDIFADIVDGKMLRAIPFDDKKSLQNAKAIWYCPTADKELPEVNKAFGEICELANEECDAFFMASSLNGREKDYLIAIDEI